VNRADGRGVGVARYIRDAADPEAADLAVTVIDAWQRRGLGSELLARLSHRARQEGIRWFTALTSTDNEMVACLLRRAGPASWAATATPCGTSSCSAPERKEHRPCAADGLRVDTWRPWRAR